MVKKRQEDAVVKGQKKSNKKKVENKDEVKESLKRKSENEETKTITLRLGGLNIILVSAIVLLSIWGTINILNINDSLGKQIGKYGNIDQYMVKVNDRLDELKELVIPAKISIVSIVDPLCSDCSSIDPLITQVKKDHVNVTSETTLDFTSNEASQLIKKYNIDLIPTIIISSNEFNKTSLLNQWKKLGTAESDGSLVLRTLNPPYVNVSQGRTVGRVTLTLIKDSTCTGCFDITSLVRQIKASGVSIVSESEIDYASEQAKSLLEKYMITKVPTIIMSSDVDEYSNIKTTWARQGSVEEDGSYILREISPPYRNLTEGRIVGQVALINLIDSSCSECYDVGMHKGIIARFGLPLSDEKTYNVKSDEGKAIVEKYNVTLVPTIILTGDPGTYPSLKGIWAQVGSVESDGTHVFRRPNVMGVKYKDLSTGEVLG